jgi:hypothetical protein
MHVNVIFFSNIECIASLMYLTQLLLSLAFLSKNKILYNVFE